MTILSDPTVTFCPECGGAGLGPKPFIFNERVRCPVCGGSGMVRVTDRKKHVCLDPEEWRQQAERIRALAVGEPTETKQRLIAIAALYDQMAESKAKNSSSNKAA